jgi:hypothetical protein
VVWIKLKISERIRWFKNLVRLYSPAIEVYTLHSIVMVLLYYIYLAHSIHLLHVSHIYHTRAMQNDKKIRHTSVSNIILRRTNNTRIKAYNLQSPLLRSCNNLLCLASVILLARCHYFSHSLSFHSHRFYASVYQRCKNLFCILLRDA